MCCRFRVDYFPPIFQSNRHHVLPFWSWVFSTNIPVKSAACPAVLGVANLCHHSSQIGIIWCRFGTCYSVPLFRWNRHHVLPFRSALFSANIPLESASCAAVLELIIFCKYSTQIGIMSAVFELSIVCKYSIVKPASHAAVWGSIIVCSYSSQIGIMCCRFWVRYCMLMLYM